MFYRIEWTENGLAKSVQFNGQADCIAWCEKYAPELLTQITGENNDN